MVGRFEVRYEGPGTTKWIVWHAFAENGKNVSGVCASQSEAVEIARRRAGQDGGGPVAVFSAEDVLEREEQVPADPS